MSTVRRKVSCRMSPPDPTPPRVVSLARLADLVCDLLSPASLGDGADPWPSRAYYSSTVLEPRVRDVADAISPGCVGTYRSAIFVSSTTATYRGHVPTGGDQTGGPVWLGVRLPPGADEEDFAGAVAAAIRLAGGP